MLTQNMQPKLNEDTCYVLLDDGIYLHNNHNDLGLKGKNLDRLFEHLIPQLDGTTTLEAITEELDAEKKRMVTLLIKWLSGFHFLKDASQNQPHLLHAAELATYASNITFIESFQTSAAHRFERFRNQHLLIIGSGLSFTSLVEASLHCGVKHIDAIITSEREVHSNSHPNVPGLFSTHDAEQTVQLLTAPNWDNEAEVLHMIQTSDAILHISDRPMLARAQLLNRLCIAQQKTCIQAIVVDDHAWIGPLVSPETGSCWECAWRRLQSNLTHLPEQLPHYAFHDHPTASSNPYLTMPTATITAQRLIFELFKYFTQTGLTKNAVHLIEIDLKTYLSTSHAFLPHPHCLASQQPIVPTASRFLQQIQQLQQQDPIEARTFVENMARCVDEKLGLFTAINDDDFVQTFLAVSQVSLSNPMLMMGQHEALKVVAVSTEMPNARLRASQRACERYAANFVDRRRLLSQETIQHHSLPAVSTTQFIGIQPLLTENETWTWAWDLHTQQSYLVPATHVFCSLHKPEHGIASGRTWEEAICQALLDWCNYLTIKQLQAAQHAYMQVDLTHAPMTSEGAYLYRLLQTAGGQITVYDVTGTLHVPTFAICLAEQVVTYSTHCTVAQALERGLEQALQQYYAEQFHLPESALVPVQDVPAILRSEQRHVPRATLPETWSERQEWLLQNFQAHRLRALAIPLDHDPALMQVLPSIVRVLLARAELKYGA